MSTGSNHLKAWCFIFMPSLPKTYWICPLWSYISFCVLHNERRLSGLPGNSWSPWLRPDTPPSLQPSCHDGSCHLASSRSWPQYSGRSRSCTRMLQEFQRILCVCVSLVDRYIWNSKKTVCENRMHRWNPCGKRSAWSEFEPDPIVEKKVRSAKI